MHRCHRGTWRLHAEPRERPFKIEVMIPDFASVPLALAPPAAPQNGVGEAGPHLREGQFSRPDWRLWFPHTWLLKH